MGIKGVSCERAAQESHRADSVEQGAVRVAAPQFCRPEISETDDEGGPARHAQAQPFRPLDKSSTTH